ncbi:periphilin-1 [Stegastes partitus]|uniref:Periphilin-1-like n=1 Tax=Stegastes partitus TaxID=144197 RepID=A0A3B5BL50_9TELE|nr:PREDICTED: periphilin-1-like [Stegastes partitus]
MAYRHGRKSIREAYEDHFTAVDAREVTVHRVVNIVEKRNPMPRQGLEFDRGFNDDSWYGSPRNYQDSYQDSYPDSYQDNYQDSYQEARSHSEGSYPPSDRRYFDDSANFGSYRRHSSPPRNGASYSQQSYGRDDLRHQLVSRSSGRPHHFRKRGRGSGPPQRTEQDRKAKEDRDDYRTCQPLVITRDRSPGRREAQPSVTVRSGSNSNNRNFSPDKDKSYSYQQSQQKHKPNVVMSHTPSSSAEGSPHSSGSSKEKPSASVAESEEVAAASMEPKLTPEEDFKARRLEAIKAKALEIEKHYRQDCETFRTVVKMLVDKEPSLDNLLQAPLDANLLDIKQHCLDALKNFMKELDEI